MTQTDKETVANTNSAEISTTDGSEANESDVCAMAVTYPAFPEYSTKNARLGSYVNWRGSQKPEDLAEAGLFYIGEGDRTKCFYCGGGLHCWEEKDDPLQQHAYWFSDCGYLAGKQ